MQKFLIATSSIPFAGFRSMIPLLVQYFADLSGASIAVVDVGVEASQIDHHFVHRDRLLPTAEASVGLNILKFYAEQQVILFDVSGSHEDDAFRLTVITHAGKAELHRQGRQAIAFVPFQPSDVESKRKAYSDAGLLHSAGYDVRLVFSSLDRSDYTASVLGRDTIHSGIPPLGRGLIDFIEREKRSLGSLVATPSAGFEHAIDHIRDWLSRCRQSMAFRDLVVPDAVAVDDPVSADNPALLPRIRLHQYWLVDRLDQPPEAGIGSAKPGARASP